MPFSHTHIKKYLLAYFMIVVVVVIFFLLNRTYNTTTIEQSRSFHKSVQKPVQSIQSAQNQESESKSRFILLEKRY